MNKNEEWKFVDWIPGFPKDILKISSTGRVLKKTNDTFVEVMGDRFKVNVDKQKYYFSASKLMFWAFRSNELNVSFEEFSASTIMIVKPKDYFKPLDVFTNAIIRNPKSLDYIKKYKPIEDKFKEFPLNYTKYHYDIIHLSSEEVNNIVTNYCHEIGLPESKELLDLFKLTFCDQADSKSKVNKSKLPRGKYSQYVSLLKTIPNILELPEGFKYVKIDGIPKNKYIISKDGSLLNRWENDKPVIINDRLNGVTLTASPLNQYRVCIFMARLMAFCFHDDFNPESDVVEIIDTNRKDLFALDNIAYSTRTGIYMRKKYKGDFQTILFNNLSIEDKNVPFDIIEKFSKIIVGEKQYDFIKKYLSSDLQRSDYDNFLKEYGYKNDKTLTTKAKLTLNKISRDINTFIDGWKNGEIWKKCDFMGDDTVPGYWISSHGRFINENHAIQNEKRNGPDVLFVNAILSSGKSKQYPLIKLMAYNFIPNPKGYSHVSYKNGYDLSIDNIEWCEEGSNKSDVKISFHDWVESDNDDMWVPLIQPGIDENRYEITCSGKIRDLVEHRIVPITGSRRLKFTNINEFIKISLIDEFDKIRIYNIHRLIAQSFLINDYNDNYVIFLDNNHRNINLDNLCYSKSPMFEKWETFKRHFRYRIDGHDMIEDVHTTSTNIECSRFCEQSDCHIICKEFVENDFNKALTRRKLYKSGIKVSRETLNEIFTGNYYRNISRKYFTYDPSKKGKARWVPV